jgi:hypothetical protein
MFLLINSLAQRLAVKNHLDPYKVFSSIGENCAQSALNGVQRSLGTSLEPPEM